MKGEQSFPLLRSNPSLLGAQPQDRAGGEGGGRVHSYPHSAEPSLTDVQQLFGITYLNKRRAKLSPPNSPEPVGKLQEA